MLLFPVTMYRNDMYLYIIITNMCLFLVTRYQSNTYLYIFITIPGEQ